MGGGGGGGGGEGPGDEAIYFECKYQVTVRAKVKVYVV